MHQRIKAEATGAWASHIKGSTFCFLILKNKKPVFSVFHHIVGH